MSTKKQKIISVDGKIKELRNKSKISQDTLARAMGFSTRTLINYEQDLQSPTVNTLKKIADYFAISTDWLLTDEGEMRRGEPNPSKRNSDNKETNTGGYNMRWEKYIHDHGTEKEILQAEKLKSEYQSEVITMGKEIMRRVEAKKRAV